ncbi:hypothetical protein LESZY_00690 [Brevundimonas phage vB_BpoS-Leszy]|nr:hypothetical protein LESZY_00690 [Brevundimonas phage vB_BpoS-Leszy]USN16491.1 hypothetical protein POLUDNITSA_00760 [Brevundimonas phage vB_BpoS-Poludnitsa]
MSTFNATFTRYGDGERQISTNTPLHGLGLNPTFDDAYRYAQALMTGMRAADPGREYEIVAINAGHDLQGSGKYRGPVACGPGVWDMPVRAFYEVERADRDPLTYYYVGRTHEDKPHFRGEISEAQSLDPRQLDHLLAEMKRVDPKKVIKTISVAR